MTASSRTFEPRITLRPRSLDETFDLALTYARSSPRALWPPCALAVLVATLPGLTLWPLLDLDIRHLFGLVLFTTAIAERGLTAYVGRHLFGSPVTLWSAMKDAIRRLPFIFAYTCIALGPLLLTVTSYEDDAQAVLGLALCGCAALGLARYAYFGEVALLENLSVRRTHGRALALTSRRSWRALLLVLTGGCVRILFGVAVYTSGDALFEHVLQFQGVTEVLGGAFAAVGYALSGPFMALVRFFDYVDARTRREGWDIQVRFQAIAQRSEARYAHQVDA